MINIFIKVIKTICYILLATLIFVYGFTKATWIFITQYLQYVWHTITNNKQ